ncbi:hypothetical protein GGR51DRAFT_557384 [Nemania sp. FL0031]|nr:hypothetical protein GGR51DRAFT_557384 [Nemania sp. FL0031]
MGGKKNARSQGMNRGGEHNQRQRSSRKHGTEGSSRRATESQPDEEAQRFTDFSIRDTSNVHVGSTHYEGGPVIHIHLSPDLIYTLATQVNGEFPHLYTSNDTRGSNPADILYHQAAPLRPNPNYRENSPRARARSTDRRRYTHNDRATSNTRHETSIDSPSVNQETPEIQHIPLEPSNEKTLAERDQRHQTQTRHEASDPTDKGPNRQEGKISWGQRWKQRLRDWRR